MDITQFLSVLTILLACGAIVLVVTSYVVGRRGMHACSLESVEAGRNISAAAAIIAIVTVGLIGYFQITILAFLWAAITMIIFFWFARCARWLIDMQTTSSQ